MLCQTTNVPYHSYYSNLHFDPRNQHKTLALAYHTGSVTRPSIENIVRTQQTVLKGPQFADHYFYCSFKQACNHGGEMTP